MKSLRLRWMQPHDFNAVLEIERSVFVDPWDRDEFLIHTAIKNVRPKVVTLARSDIPIAYVVYYLGNQTEILNIAVRPQFQQKGVGSAMVNSLVDNLGVRRNQVIADVCETFPVAQSFFRSLGFRASKLIRNFDKDVDAYRFEFDRDFSSPVRRSPSKKATL